ncbi:MAG TPA: hypothetical protein PKC65_01825 [Pyrinomonadaceae bacterium]|nr:hypothetical protein [Pyrinomonadaceae bacterium]
MQEKVTPHLKKQFGVPEIHRQYILPTEVATVYDHPEIDPLHEGSYSPIKGLVHKFANRALIKVSFRCAAHCQFCTRSREIGLAEGDLASADIKSIRDYIERRPEINDVILSGGDPFYTPKISSSILDVLSEVTTIKIFRVGTRLPCHNPRSFSTKPIQELLERLEKLAETRPIFVLINFSHPAELGDETRTVIADLRRRGMLLLSQTVFLRGINDDFETLRQLFEQLYFIGVQPYYLYRCDQVKGLESYVCDLDKEILIASQLRSHLSGIACPTYIVDVTGRGKIPVPLNFWEDTDVTTCRDFDGVETSIV